MVLHWFYIPLSPGKAGSSWERVVLLAFRRNLHSVVTYQANLGRTLSKRICRKKVKKRICQKKSKSEYVKKRIFNLTARKRVCPLRIAGGWMLGNWLVPADHFLEVVLGEEGTFKHWTNVPNVRDCKNLKTLCPASASLVNPTAALLSKPSE